MGKGIFQRPQWPINITITGGLFIKRQGCFARFAEDAQKT
jgi:hypothetical protein